MFVFKHRETTMSVDKPDVDSALEFADKMLVSVADGYWKCNPNKVKHFTWTPIVRTASVYVEDN